MPRYRAAHGNLNLRVEVEPIFGTSSGVVSKQRTRRSERWETVGRCVANVWGPPEDVRPAAGAIRQLYMVPNAPSGPTVVLPTRSHRRAHPLPPALPRLLPPERLPAPAAVSPCSAGASAGAPTGVPMLRRRVLPVHPQAHPHDRGTEWSMQASPGHGPRAWLPEMVKSSARWANDSPQYAADGHKPPALGREATRAAAEWNQRDEAMPRAQGK